MSKNLKKSKKYQKNSKGIIKIKTFPKKQAFSKNLTKFQKKIKKNVQKIIINVQKKSKNV